MGCPFESNINFDLAFVYRTNKKMIPRVGSFLDEFDAFLDEEDYLSRLKDNY